MAEAPNYSSRDHFRRYVDMGMSDSVSRAINELFRAGKLTPEDLDAETLKALMDAPPRLAFRAVCKFGDLGRLSGIDRASLLLDVLENVLSADDGTFQVPFELPAESNAVACRPEPDRRPDFPAVGGCGASGFGASNGCFLSIRGVSVVFGPNSECVRSARANHWPEFSGAFRRLFSAGLGEKLARAIVGLFGRGKITPAELGGVMNLLQRAPPRVALDVVLEFDNTNVSEVGDRAALLTLMLEGDLEIEERRRSNMRTERFEFADEEVPRLVNGAGAAGDCDWDLDENEDRDGDRRRGSRRRNRITGFTIFLREARRNEPRNGAVGGQDLTSVAYAQWRALTEGERMTYELKAWDEHALQVRDRSGELLVDIIARENAAMQQREDIEALVRWVVDKHYASRTLFASFELGGFSFCVACVEIFGETDDGTIFPAEFALMRGTIGEGVIEGKPVSHQIFECGDIPLGYRHTFVEHSRNRHKISVDMRLPAPVDYAGLVSDIQAVIGSGRDTDEQLAIFVHPSKQERLEKFFTWLWEKAGSTAEKPSLCSIYTLASFAFIPDNPDFKPAKLYRSPCLDYMPGFACQWHQEVRPDAMIHCAQYNVKKHIGLLQAYLDDYPEGRRYLRPQAVSNVSS